MTSPSLNRPPEPRSSIRPSSAAAAPNQRQNPRRHRTRSSRRNFHRFGHHLDRSPRHHRRVPGRKRRRRERPASWPSSAPLVTAPTPHIKYCTYLGITAQVGIGGSRSRRCRQRLHRRLHFRSWRHLSNSQRLPNHLRRRSLRRLRDQNPPIRNRRFRFGLRHIPGRRRTDQALAITVSAAMPATAYVTGTTQSTKFPHEWNQCRRAIHSEGNCEGKCERFFLRHRTKCHHGNDVASSTPLTSAAHNPILA